MGTESTKTQSIRSKEFIDTYFSGGVIDIGGGNDPVVKHAEVFDLIHGDYSAPTNQDNNLKFLISNELNLTQQFGVKNYE